MILLLAILCAPLVQAKTVIDGDWFGSFQHPQGRVFILLHFVSKDGQPSGTIDLTSSTTSGRGKRLEKLKVNDERIHFESVDPVNGFSFDGRVTNGVITGELNERTGKCLVRFDWMAKTDRARFVGTYQVGTEHFISVFSNFFCLIGFDSQSGKLSMLLPRAENIFVCGAGLETFPVEAKVDFSTNGPGESTGIQWKPNKGTALIGKRVAIPERQVSFKNGETTLAGTLVLPRSKGPHPAVVFIHGSGPAPRAQYRLIADFFALNGIASLIYDKRGCGDSTGDWHTSGFNDLAADALAGLELLRNRPEINNRQIGLWGISQGGWLVGLAASQSTNVAFIINVSGRASHRKRKVHTWWNTACRPKAFLNRIFAKRRPCII